MCFTSDIIIKKSIKWISASPTIKTVGVFTEYLSIVIKQGTLTEGENTVQLTSSLRELVL